MLGPVYRDLPATDRGAGDHRRGQQGDRMAKPQSRSTRRPKGQDAPPRRRMRGFEAASTLLAGRIRQAGESRGFAVSRLLTNWPEVVGRDLAAICRPVRITHPRDGFGATLVLLTTGPTAPMVEMQAPLIREKVNACYGFNAVARVRVTQTAPTGFADGQAVFAPAPKPRPDPAAERARQQAAQDMVPQFDDSELRDKLLRLAQNILSRRDRNHKRKVFP